MKDAEHVQPSPDDILTVYEMAADQLEYANGARQRVNDINTQRQSIRDDGRKLEREEAMSLSYILQHVKGSKNNSEIDGNISTLERIARGEDVDWARSIYLGNWAPVYIKNQFEKVRVHMDGAVREAKEIATNELLAVIDDVSKRPTNYALLLQTKQRNRYIDAFIQIEHDALNSDDEKVQQALQKSCIKLEVPDLKTVGDYISYLASTKYE